ncbi:signal peptidase II [Tissierella sp.]|uniref:signal peptidase II n=1 Tax=Tissierella sp. TaxID=41274 RepID=UPI002858B4C8|nr:signal peptidase II [Tissierella sp.]MDR7856401.1 signal peptidase II [Tissierella sp.]
MIFILPVFIILLDQISKYAVVKYLMGSAPHVIISNFFQFSYVENYGAAFGILQNKKIFFVIITLAVIIGISIFLVKNYYSINFFMRIGLGMLLGGAIGNFIDRVRLGYVVDFISFRLFNIYDFPVFNIADISVVVGTIIILILILFDKYEA